MKDRYYAEGYVVNPTLTVHVVRDRVAGLPVQGVDATDRLFPRHPIVFALREHAEDFAAALNLGAKARAEAGEPEGGA